MKKATVIAISIHEEKDNPYFGESAIHMRIEDESGGGFFVITQIGNTEIRADIEDVLLMASEGKKIMDAYYKVTK